MSPAFILADSTVINVDNIAYIDTINLESLKIRLVHKDGAISIASSIKAIEILMLLKPSALEGRKLKWKRHMWAFHNLVGHPVMQLLALAGFRELAIKVHDMTVPKPNV